MAPQKVSHVIVFTITQKKGLVFRVSPPQFMPQLFPGLLRTGMRPGFERVVAAQPAARRSSAAQTVAMLAAAFVLVALVHTVSVYVPAAARFISGGPGGSERWCGRICRRDVSGNSAACTASLSASALAAYARGPSGS